MDLEKPDLDMLSMNKIVISVCCITYNHKPYIRQCLDGFMMQKTNFLFEVLIHDDASTDGTADIIREYEQRYPEIIKPIYQTENQYSKGVKISITYNFPRAKGKYIALCEGDDYWTDTYKLQKQVDFLEKNPEYGMCYTKAKRYHQNKKKMLKKLCGGPFVISDELISNNSIPTLTVLLKKDLQDRYLQEVKPETKNWLMGDHPMWLWFFYNSKIYFFDKVTSVYRILDESASHSRDFIKMERFCDSNIEIQKYFLTKYNLSYRLENLENQKMESLAYLAVLYNRFDQFKLYISKTNRKHIKILIKKIIAKSHLLFVLYNLYLRFAS
jgi:glycosyltransferase involved in cell wall biosynthesis